MNNDTTRDEPKLAPCPFCGGADIVALDTDDGIHTVICSDCGVTANRGDTMPEADPVTAWNRRAACSSLPDGPVAPVPRGYAQAPKELWIQLHGDCSDAELDEPVDYEGDDVTWCWHKINASDVRYVRADLAALAAPSAQPPVEGVAEKALKACQMLVDAAMVTGNSFVAPPAFAPAIRAAGAALRAAASPSAQPSGAPEVQPGEARDAARYRLLRQFNLTGGGGRVGGLLAFGGTRVGRDGIERPYSHEVLDEMLDKVLDATAPTPSGAPSDTTKRRKVYIASPYTKGDTAVNVKRQIDTADELIGLGYAPHAPLYNHFQHMAHPRPYEDWIALDLEWVTACDVVLRLEGESSGADGEVAFANQHGIPVVYSIGALVAEYPAALAGAPAVQEGAKP